MNNEELKDQTPGEAVGNPEVEPAPSAPDDAPEGEEADSEAGADSGEGSEE
ncbi:MAG: hypothetical protein WD883_00030 [Candidatus Colwellbacteria bacterium]